MKEALARLFTSVLQEMGVENPSVDVVMTEHVDHGDYTTNLAMKLAKTLKKSPMDIALQVVDEVKKQKSLIDPKDRDLNTHKGNQNISGIASHKDVLQAIDHIDAVAPGFINVFLTEATLGTSISQVLKHAESYGIGKSPEYKRITVEFTDPNPFKEFHIGHLYSNTVGESLCRILASQGHTVRRVCYQGDVGMHVAKALYGLLQINDIENALEAIAKKPLADRAKFMGSAYVVGAKAFEEDTAAAEVMKTLNRLGFIAAQAMWVQKKGITPIIDYRSGATIDEALLSKVSLLYEKGRVWSLEYFETIYHRLGTAFEGYYFESMVGERGVTLVRDHLKDGVFEQSDGAIIYKGEKKGLHTRVFINQLGLPTYEAKELGLAPTKYEDWPYDQSIIITGNEINEYFKVLLAALSEITPELAIKTKHMGHGMVRKADGSKMSSRSGEILTGEGLLDEVKASIHTLLDKNESKYTKEAREDIAEKAAVAAVKYSLLRVSLSSDVAFDISTSVSFEGDSGPYLLYTYARCKSLIAKGVEQGVPRETSVSKSGMNKEERLLSRYIHFYPQIVADTAATFSPSILCKYLFELSSAFNGFYAKYTILGEAEHAAHRLELTGAVAQVLKNGLNLLGIETVERM